MKNVFIASRLSEPVCGYTVLLRSSGTSNTDLSLWLNDDEARALGEALLQAAAQPAATLIPEAA